MAKAFPLKMRGRIGAARMRARMRKLRDLEEMAETGLAPEALREIEHFEKQEKKVKSHKYAFLRGRLTELAVQDFIGAAFGAMFFVVTQEVWEISARLHAWQLGAVLAISIFVSLSLVYFSRRRRFISEVAYSAPFVRGLEVYAISFLTSVLFVVTFGTAAGAEILRQSIVVSLPATVSAATADLLFY